MTVAWIAERWPMGGVANSTPPFATPCGGNFTKIPVTIRRDLRSREVKTGRHAATTSLGNPPRAGRLRVRVNNPDCVFAPVPASGALGEAQRRHIMKPGLTIGQTRYELLTGITIPGSVTDSKDRRIVVFDSGSLRNGCSGTRLGMT